MKINDNQQRQMWYNAIALGEKTLKSVKRRQYANMVHRNNILKR